MNRNPEVARPRTPRFAALVFFCGLVLALPAPAIAAEEGGGGSWIDFSQYGFDALTRVINIHPVFVHFPLVLIPLVLLFYAGGVLMKWRSWLIAGRVTLYLAFVAVIAAVITGLQAGGSFPHGEAIEHVMKTHKHTGYVILGLTGLLSLWSFWHAHQIPRGIWAFLLVIALASYFVLQNGDLGSRMVYLQGAAVKPLVHSAPPPPSVKPGG